MEELNLIIDDVVDLNSLIPNGSIECPYCGKGKAYIYNATGMVSFPCSKCHRMVLWDYDNKDSYKAKVRKFAC
jgi:DNA-directed RNA polymerase subunit RPC12/RpoP